MSMNLGTQRYQGLMSLLGMDGAANNSQLAKSITQFQKNNPGNSGRIHNPPSVGRPDRPFNSHELTQIKFNNFMDNLLKEIERKHKEDKEKKAKFFAAQYRNIK